MTLTAREREQLGALIRSGRPSARTITRARILLLTSWSVSSPAPGGPPGGPSAEFVTRMEGVLDVYHRPYDPTPPLIGG